jgi:LPS sulfotransferase NodH
VLDSYLMCGTPRTGSTLLCGLLASTGVAGYPESYFRRQDEASYARRWGIPIAPDGASRYADYVRAAIEAGRTRNGVFAARIMWGTMDELTGGLRAACPGLPGRGRDADLLSTVFGQTRYLYLWREGAVRQAVSWLRAEQTGFWHDTGGPGEAQAPHREPRYDGAEISRLVGTIREDNQAWRDWFAAQGVQPYPVRYEDLDADPAGVTRSVLSFLGLKPPPGCAIIAPSRRLADGVSDDWVARYRAAAPAG